MTKKDRRLPLGGLGGDGDDDLGRIREYGLRRGFIPTETTDITPPSSAFPSAPMPVAVTPPSPAIALQPVAIPPPPAAAHPPVPVVRPAATRPWQAMFPDYLIEALRKAAAQDGTAQKVVVMRALRLAGFRVDDIDLQDLRRR